MEASSSGFQFKLKLFLSFWKHCSLGCWNLKYYVERNCICSEDNFLEYLLCLLLTLSTVGTSVYVEPTLRDVKVELGSLGINIEVAV